MAVTNLSEFRGRGVITRLVLAPIAQAHHEVAKPIEVFKLVNIGHLERVVADAGLKDWQPIVLEISCDFAMPRHEDVVFNSVYSRVKAGLVEIRPAEGITRKLEVVNGKTIRTTVELIGPKIPAQLGTLDGWRGFRFESLRTLFQFKAPDSAVVDEELHERIRHALRNLTRHFQRVEAS